MSVKIIITLVGDEDLLDLPEGDYAVRNIDDTAERTKQLVKELGNKYKNYGWSVVSAEKNVE